MANAYPELPQLPYQRTSVSMTDVIAWLKAADLPSRIDIPLEVKRSTYIIFRIESSNGQAGINNNYAGMQADGGRWPPSLDHYFTGTTTVAENTTGRSRVFLCFASWQDSVACLAERLTARGLYVGGTTSHIAHLDVTDATQLARAYQKEWASGSVAAEPSAAALGNFLSMYAQAAALFRPDVTLQMEKVTLPGAPTVAVNPSFDAVAEVARLRAALTRILVDAQATLAMLPTPGDTSADALNAAELARIRRQG